MIFSIHFKFLVSQSEGRSITLQQSKQNFKIEVNWIKNRVSIYFGKLCIYLENLAFILEIHSQIVIFQK